MRGINDALFHDCPEIVVQTDHRRRGGVERCDDLRVFPLDLAVRRDLQALLDQFGSERRVVERGGRGVQVDIGDGLCLSMRRPSANKSRSTIWKHSSG